MAPANITFLCLEPKLEEHLQATGDHKCVTSSANKVQGPSLLQEACKVVREHLTVVVRRGVSGMSSASKYVLDSQRFQQQG